MNRDGRDARLAMLASRQAGTFTLAQAEALAYPRTTIRRRLRSGTWDRALPGVYRLGGSERSRLQDLWVAVLAVGPAGTLTHETSALCHGAERLLLDPVVLTNPHRWHHRLPGIVVHQIDDLLPIHRTRWNGLPISRPARAVVEIAATQSEHVVGLVADDLVRLRKTTYRQIERAFWDVCRPGKPGMQKLARVLDDRGDGYVPPASELERALLDAIAASGLPAPERQVPLPGRGTVRGLVDGAYRDTRIVLEADGRRWHDRVEASKRDHDRDRQALRAGWVTMRFLYEHVVHEPDDICADIRQVRAGRLDLFRRAA